MFVPEWARLLLGLRPEDRGRKDVTRLASMLKTLRYFKNDIQFEKLEDLCRHATFALYVEAHTYRHDTDVYSLHTYGHMIQALSMYIVKIHTCIMK